VVLLGLLGGCGGGATRFSGAGPSDAGGGGELRYALADDPGDFDPLHATTISAQLVDRQLFEPLVERLQGPYGSVSERRGLAVGWHPSGDYRVWSFALRTGVRFQDDTPLNAEAVVANAERWRSDPAGQRLLPGLVAADAPSPHLVRLILARPDRGLPAKLANPRLAIVSPPALTAQGSGGTILGRAQRAGSGPFELQRRGAGRVILTRYRGWWGSRHGLGPELDAVAFSVLPAAGDRVDALRSGAVRVAGDLPSAPARALQRDPLLTSLGAASGHAVAFERSVRGIRGWRPEPLSGVWVALVARTG
jgi:peptide/nickel transport system substrate-binding protein